MKNNPKITVLMTVYNGGKYLSASIESVLNQRFSDFELLIINDCSTDNSVDVINSFRDERIVLHHNKKNLGQTTSLNIGIKLASAEYIARIDADDIAFPDWLKKQMDFVSNHCEYAVVSAGAVVIDENGKVTRTYIPPASRQDILLRALLDSPINHVGSIMHKKVIVSCGGYDERYKIIADYKLWSDLLRKEERIVSLSDILVAIRVHSASSSISSGEGAYISEWTDIIYDNVKYLSSADISTEEISILCRANYHASSLSDDEFKRAVEILYVIYDNIRNEFKLDVPLVHNWYMRQLRTISLKRIYYFIQEGNIHQVKELCSFCIGLFGKKSIFSSIYAICMMGKNILIKLPSIYYFSQKLNARRKLSAECRQFLFDLERGIFF